MLTVRHCVTCPLGFLNVPGSLANKQRNLNLIYCNSSIPVVHVQSKFSEKDSNKAAIVPGASGQQLRCVDKSVADQFNGKKVIKHQQFCFSNCEGIIIIIIFIYLPSDVISQEKTATSSRSTTKTSKYAIPLKPTHKLAESKRYLVTW